MQPPLGRVERLVRVDVEKRPRDDEVSAARGSEERVRPCPAERPYVRAVLLQLRDTRAVAEVCHKAQRRVLQLSVEPTSMSTKSNRGAMNRGRFWLTTMCSGVIFNSFSFIF